MTRISSKLVAVLIATVTIGGAVISSTDEASARMRGERMGMGRMHHGHGHGHFHRHGHGFGRGALIGLGVGAAGVIIANAVAAQPVIYAESYDTRSRVRVRSEKVGNDRVVTTTDAKGKQAREVKKPNEPASISWTNPETGETTTITHNADGSKTLTTKDAKGNEVKKVEPKTADSATSVDRNTGVTKTSTANPDGSHTVTTTDANGNTNSVDVPKNGGPAFITVVQ
jgi:hypothetical protein